MVCKKLSLQVAVSRFNFSLQVAVTVCVNLSLQVASCDCENLSLQVAMILLNHSLQVAVSQAYTWPPRKRLQMLLAVTSFISNLVVLCSVSAV